MEIINETLKFFENFTQTECKGSYRLASTRLGLNYQTLYAWLVKKDRVPTLKALEPVLARLNVKLTFPNTRLLDYFFPPCGQAYHGADGQLAINEQPHTPFAFEEGWLRDKGVNKDDALIIQVQDEAMAPTLSTGDYALINTADKLILTNRIYLVSMGQDLMLRRIIRMPRGLTLHADNQEWVDVPIEQDDMPALIVHGRMRFSARTFA